MNEGDENEYNEKDEDKEEIDDSYFIQVLYLLEDYVKSRIEFSKNGRIMYVSSSSHLSLEDNNKEKEFQISEDDLKIRKDLDIINRFIQIIEERIECERETKRCGTCFSNNIKEEEIINGSGCFYVRYLSFKEFKSAYLAYVKERYILNDFIIKDTMSEKSRDNKLSYIADKIQNNSFSIILRTISNCYLTAAEKTYIYILFNKYRNDNKDEIMKLFCNE